jgi:metallo-beta-lactamase family protein
MHMKLSFFGAAGEVTGSCSLLEVGRSKVLIDCGMHQGDRLADTRNRRELPFSVQDLSAVVLTHAHIDHSGRLPLLAKHGLKAPIYATPATCKLAGILLEDSASLQEVDAMRDSVRNARRGLPPVEPLYTPKHVPPVLALLRDLPYGRSYEIAPGISLRFSDAGHILGSASVELAITEPDGTKKLIVLSADIGPKGMPLLRDPVPPVMEGRKPDLVVLESTYGDRDHRAPEATIEEFAGLLREAMWDKCKVLVPAFAVGRTQTLLYHLRALSDSGRCPRFPVFLDSPMAVKATQLFQHFRKELDEESIRLLSQGDDPMGLNEVTPVASGKDSQALNDRHGAMVIIAASGMCNGGRIMHHLKHNLYKRDVRIIIAGYQAQGTLGRRLVDGADEVRIMGETVVVRAKIHTMGGLSAHAGQTELLSWARTYAPAASGTTPNTKAPLFVLTHGEDKPREALATKLRDTMGVKTQCPQWGGFVEL